MVFLPTADEIRMIVREELQRALRELGPRAPEVMDTVQAAAWARRSQKTIRKWIVLGLPHTKRGRQFFVRREDLERWREGPRGPKREWFDATVRRLTAVPSPRRPRGRP